MTEHLPHAPAILALAWLALTFIVSVILALAQGSLLARRAATGAAAAAFPPVSVLRPLRGVDPDLAANLESLFRQDHPDFEILLGAADADDPALGVARGVAARFPHVPCTVVADARRVGLNPKVNNLANLARVARHDVVVISDSNVALAPDHLTHLASRLATPGAALVSAPIRARPAGTLGSALESLQINTYVMGGVAGVTLWFGGVCCVGKTMAFRRSDLDAVGGFAHLGRHLAEDQVAAESFARAGLGVTVASLPVDNVLGPLTLREFCARHLRWARIRRWMSPAGYAAEILSNPVACALAAFAALPSGTAAAAVAALFAARGVCDAVMERRLGVLRPVWSYPLLLALKETLFLALWPLPFLGRSVTWRGRRFLLGPRTSLAERAAPGASAHARAHVALADVVLDFDPLDDPVAATA